MCSSISRAARCATNPPRKSACWWAPGCPSNDDGGDTMKFYAIMRRDLRKLVRNPITLITTILMPIVYLVIIGNSFQGQLKHLPVVIVAQDHGLYARRLIEEMLAL